MTTMTPPTIATTVGELVTQRPGRSRVFQQLGIDFCCGGKKPLAEACADKGLDPNTVLTILLAAEADAPSDEKDWSQESLTALADHIEQTHHAYLREELPRLGAMVRRVAAVHGDQHPWLREVSAVFKDFVAELESHMLKEEQILFPAVRHLDSGGALPHGAMNIASPIEAMEHEHEEAGRALSRMRELSNNYTPPENACGTFRAALDGLEELERDMHRHVHKENSILFPRALDLQRSRRGG